MVCADERSGLLRQLKHAEAYRKHLFIQVQCGSHSATYCCEVTCCLHPKRDEDRTEEGYSVPCNERTCAHLFPTHTHTHTHVHNGITPICQAGSLEAEERHARIPRHTGPTLALSVSKTSCTFRGRSLLDEALIANELDSHDVDFCEEELDEVLEGTKVDQTND